MTYQHEGRSRRRLTATVTDLDVTRQKAFLVGMVRPEDDREGAERSLDELALLTDTAGSDPVDRELVRRPAPDPGLFVGRGKAKELADITRALEIDVVVFDNALSPAQQRNLHKMFECDVVDREALILDIFAQHATSKAGALQVELALLQYHLPRLRGKGVSLSQQGAGIGTRGPGETKLETDRRRIRDRIAKLNRDLAEVARHRDTQRKSRRRSHIPLAALVGYTNAGKSTLLNRITSAGVLAENRLFSTLDSTVRRAELGDGRGVLLSDTVGFVRRLPHHLVEAFHSTLEEVKEADILLHLVDSSDPDPTGQISAVRDVLYEIGAHEVPELLVLNKIDVAHPNEVERLRALYPDAVAISAATGQGVDLLVHEVGQALDRGRTAMTLLIPYERGDVVAAVHREAEVVVEKHEPAGTILHARVPAGSVHRFTEFAVD